MINQVIAVGLLIFSTTTSFSQEARFTYQFHNSNAKGGRLVFDAPDSALSFKADASAGYLVAANNPYFQATTKNMGPIPNGSWTIYEIKNESKCILRLKPGDDVTITERDGFLIHGTGKDSTPEQSSKGCIILSRPYREKLLKAFKKYGDIKIHVTNFVTSDPTKEG
jgi:hypothetical protein